MALKLLFEAERMMESPNKREAEIVILEEGPGNKARKCWYGIEALESGRDIFRGAQVYSDHPSNSEQKDLPERSVRDIIGRIKETWICRNPKTGKRQLRGMLRVFEGKDYDWVVSLIKESIQADKEGFSPVAQVSIHADGDIEPRFMEGEKYNYVTRIKSAVSVDVVTKGGIKNSGFLKFMENALGGYSMSMQDSRFRQIQQKLAESLTQEEATFLENYLQEAGGEVDGFDEEFEDEFEDEPEVFEDEDGNIYALTDEVDEAGNPLLMDEAGDLVSVGEPEIIYDDFEDDYEDDSEDDFEDDFEDDYPGAQMASSGDDVGLYDLADQFPALASEIDQEEMGTMESERDYDIAMLKMENKLLKSRVIAENKLAESGLPEGLIPIRELVGKAPSEMDAIIEGRARMFESIRGMVQGSQAALIEADTARNGNDEGVGRRILRGALMAR